MTLPKPSAVLFDWDLTLVNSFQAIVAAYNYTMDKFGMARWTEEKIRASTAHSLKDSFPKVFGDRWEEARDIFHNHFADVHLNHIFALPDVFDLLETIKNHVNCPMGIVSNKTPKYLIEEVEFLGFLPFMSVVIGSGEAKNDKPAPDPIFLALERMKIPAGKDVWFIGDTISDIRAGNSAGCTSVMIGEKNAAVVAENPDIYVRDILELQNIVIKI